MAGKGTTGGRKNTLYHGTMIDLTDDPPPDDSIDLTEEEEPIRSPQEQPVRLAPTKPQQSPLKVSINQRLNVLNQRLNVHSLSSVETQTAQSTTAQTSQEQPRTQLPQTRPVLTPPANLVKRILPKALNQPRIKPTQQAKLTVKPPHELIAQLKPFDPSSQAKPSQQKQQQTTALNPGVRKIVTNRVLTKVPDHEARLSTQMVKNRDEIARLQLAALQKHKKRAQVSKRPPQKNAVLPEFNSQQPEADPAVLQVETDAQAEGIVHQPVLAPCLDPTGQYVMVPAAMLRHMMVPVGVQSNSTPQTFIMMPNMTQSPIVVQNVENQSNYIKSVVNTAPTVHSYPKEPVLMQPPKPISKPPSVAAAPIRKTGPRLTVKSFSHLLEEKMDDVPSPASEVEVSCTSNVGIGNQQQVESSFVDLTELDPSDVKQEEKEKQGTEEKQAEEEVHSETVYLADLGIADGTMAEADPFGDTFQLPETVVMGTVTPVDIGTILKQPIRAAPTDEWCFESELSDECRKYTVRNNRFIGFARLERERTSICETVIHDLYNENLRSLLKHKRILRDLDSQKLRERLLRGARNQLKKLNAFRRPAPKETPFLPHSQRNSAAPSKRTLPPKEKSFLPGRTHRDSSGASSSSSSRASSVEMLKKRGRKNEKLKVPVGRNPPARSSSTTASSRSGVEPRAKRKYTKRKVTEAVMTNVRNKNVTQYVPKNVPAASGKQYTRMKGYVKKNMKRRPPMRPPVEAMTDADNPNGEDNDLFLVKKVQILNKDHNVVSLRYNPNCV